MELLEGEQLLDGLLHPAAVERQQVVLGVLFELGLHLLDGFESAGGDVVKGGLQGLAGLADLAAHSLYNN